MFNLNNEAVFIIDGAYLILGGNQLQYQNKQHSSFLTANFVENFKIFTQNYFGINFVQGVFASADNGGEQRERNRAYYKKFKSQGFETDIREYKQKNTVCPSCHHKYKMNVQAEVDIAIAMHIMKYCGFRKKRMIENLVFLAGDRDFKDALKFVKEHLEINIFLFGFKSNMSAELIPCVTQHIFLDDIWDQLNGPLIEKKSQPPPKVIFQPLPNNKEEIKQVDVIHQQIKKEEKEEKKIPIIEQNKNEDQNNQYNDQFPVLGEQNPADFKIEEQKSPQIQFEEKRNIVSTPIKNQNENLSKNFEEEKVKNNLVSKSNNYEKNQIPLANPSHQEQFDQNNSKSQHNSSPINFSKKNQGKSNYFENNKQMKEEPKKNTEDNVFNYGSNKKKKKWRKKNKNKKKQQIENPQGFPNQINKEDLANQEKISKAIENMKQMGFPPEKVLEASKKINIDEPNYQNELYEQLIQDLC